MFEPHSHGKSFTNQILQDVTNVFRFFDSDQDGFLSHTDAINVWKKFGLIVDINTLSIEKQVDLEMFLERLEAEYMKADTEAHLRQVFTILDRGCKGYIDVDDMLDYFTNLSEVPEKKYVTELCELINSKEEPDVNNNTKVVQMEKVASVQSVDSQTADATTTDTTEPLQETKSFAPKKNFTFEDFADWIKKEQRRKNRRNSNKLLYQ